MAMSPLSNILPAEFLRVTLGSFWEIVMSISHLIGRIMNRLTWKIVCRLINRLKSRHVSSPCCHHVVWWWITVCCRWWSRSWRTWGSPSTSPESSTRCWSSPTVSSQTCFYMWTAEWTWSSLFVLFRLSSCGFTLFHRSTGGGNIPAEVSVQQR